MRRHWHAETQIAVLAIWVMSAIAMSLSISGCGVRRDPRVVLDDGRKLVEPVVTALEAYQAKHGHYPEKLDVLVAERLTGQLPQLPKRRGDLDRPPIKYEVGPGGGFYYLHFAYDLPVGMLPEVYTRYYISYEKKWQTRKYPPVYEDLAARYTGQRWRESHSPQDLQTAVDTLIAGAMRASFSRAMVRDALGTGTLVVLPPDVGSTASLAECYGTTAGGLQYCFVYKPTDPRIMAAKPAFDRDPNTVVEIYKITSSTTASATWQPYFACL